MIDRIKAFFGFFPTFGGVARSPLWRYVRAQHLKKYPMCAVTGRTYNLEVHHIRPYHLEPSLELDSHNLITLNRDVHFIFGHLMNWSSYNKDIEKDARIMIKKMETRP